MLSSVWTAALTVLAAIIANVYAETHTISFTNNCVFGTPILIQGPNVLSTGGPFTVDGALRGAIAYLQTGGCAFNGEGFTLLKTTLASPSTDGSGSSTDISLTPPYYNGCTDANCNTAFRVSTDTFVQVACQIDNVNLAVKECHPHRF
ncbi:glycopeptide [Mycena vulgaris]|nr:glycopeptide [Mycena vulgaris]